MGVNDNTTFRSVQIVIGNVAWLVPEQAADHIVAFEAELDAVRQIMNQPWDESHDRGHQEAFRRLAKIGNTLNVNSDPLTEDTPQVI